MDVDLRGKVDLLADNYYELKKIFKYDLRKLNYFEALISSKNDCEINSNRVKEIRKHLLKEKKSKYCLSNSIIKVLSLFLADSSEYEDNIKKIFYIYDNLDLKKNYKNNTLIFGSLVLAKRYSLDKLDDVINKIRIIHNELNTIDIFNISILTSSNKEIYQNINDINMIKDLLDEIDIEFTSSIYGLAVILTCYSNEVEANLEKALNIKCNIKSELFELPEEAFPLLAISTFIVNDEYEFSKELSEIYNYLKSKKGYKYFINSNTRMIISFTLLLYKYIEEYEADLIDINIENKGKLLLTLDEYTAFALSLI